MDRQNQAKKLLPIIQALADGKDLQFSFNGKTWIDETDKLELKTIVDDICADSCDYRIKPEECMSAWKDEPQPETTLTKTGSKVTHYVNSKMVCPKCNRLMNYGDLKYHCECGYEESALAANTSCITNKQSSTVRPFNNYDELVKVYAEKFPKDTFGNGVLIWVSHKDYETVNLVTAYDNNINGESCVFIQDMWVDMKELYEKYEFLDGSICGVEQ